MQDHLVVWEVVLPIFCWCYSRRQADVRVREEHNASIRFIATLPGKSTHTFSFVGILHQRLTHPENLHWNIHTFIHTYSIKIKGIAVCHSNINNNKSGLFWWRVTLSYLLWCKYTLLLYTEVVCSSLIANQIKSLYKVLGSCVIGFILAPNESVSCAEPGEPLGYTVSNCFKEYVSAKYRRSLRKVDFEVD